MKKHTSFRKWLSENNQREIDEMAVIGFGQHSGKDHTQLPNEYIYWMREKIASGEGKFSLTDNGRYITNPNQIDRILSQELQRRGVPQERPKKSSQDANRGSKQNNVQSQMSDIMNRMQQSQSQIPETTPAGSGKVYYLATSKALENVPKGEPVVAYAGIGSWTYQDRKGKTGTVNTSQVGSMIQRVNDENGELVSGRDIQDLFAKFDELKNILPSDQKPKDKNGIIEDEEGDQINASKGGHMGRPKPEDVRIAPERMTEYNKKIESYFNNTNENIMIDALAGTGKTTMLKHLSSFIKPGEKWLYLVFNKKNQVESSKAFPAGVDVLTTHSFLGKILKNSGKDIGGETQLPPEGQKWRKIWKVADRVMESDWPSVDSPLNYRNRRTGEWTSPFHWKAKNITTKLADLGKAYAIDPTKSDSADKLKEIIVQHGLETDISTEKINQDRDYTPDMIKMCLEILRLTMPNGLQDRHDEMYNFRDQDDTLWYAALNADKIRWNPDGYKVVLLDEVQDFNECQLIMAKKLKEAGCRVISVGDPNQAMYGFRGANAEAFHRLKEIIGSGESQSLPINFRSGGNIIDWVKNNTHVNNLQAAPHLQGKGAVYAKGGTHPPLKYNDFLNNITEEFKQNGMSQEATAVISRTNSPLGHAALYFLKNNLDFQIVGKDLSRDLVELIKKTTMSKPENVDIESYSNKLNVYVEDLDYKWSNKISKRDELKDIKEFAGVLQAVLSYLAEKEYKETENSRPMSNVKDFQLFLERKLGGLDPDNEKDAAKIKSQDPRKVVTLTTAHKSKGLEWDRVFLMKPEEYDPSKPNIKTQEQAQQEMNAWYVAATRGRKTLMVSEDNEPK